MEKEIGQGQWGRRQEKEERDICSRGAKNCLWIEGKIDMAHKNMEVYKGKQGNPVLG